MTKLILLQSLYPHHALCNAPLYRPPPTARPARKTFSRHMDHPQFSCRLTNALLTCIYDSLVYHPLRHMATILPLPHHSPPARENRSRSPYLLHLAPQILLQSLDRQICHLTPRIPPRACVHVNPIHLRRANHDALPDLVLVPVRQRHLPHGCFLLEHLQRRDVLHRCVWQALPERARGYET